MSCRLVMVGKYPWSLVCGEVPFRVVVPVIVCVRDFEVLSFRPLSLIFVSMIPHLFISCLLVSAAHFSSMCTRTHTAHTTFMLTFMFSPLNTDMCARAKQVRAACLRPHQ